MLVRLSVLTSFICICVSCAARGPELGGSLPNDAEAERSSARALSVSHSMAGGRASAEQMALAGWLAYMHGGGDDVATERFEEARERDGSNALALLGLADIAMKRLDSAAVVERCLALLSEAPSDPLASVALVMLDSALGSDADLDLRAARRLDWLLGHEETRPEVRVVARQVLSRLRSDRGQDEKAVALMGAGAPSEWTIVGPFSRFTRLEVAEPRRFESATVESPEAGGESAWHLEGGRIEASYSGPLGEVRPGREPAPEGELALVGAARSGDVYYAAVDVEVPVAGDYLLWWRSGSDVRALLSGVEVIRRDAIDERSATSGLQPVHLSAGAHRLIVRVVKGIGAGRFRLNVLDETGAPADVVFTPASGDPEPLVATTQPRGRTRRARRAADEPRPVRPSEGGRLDHLLHSRLDADPTTALTSYLSAFSLIQDDLESAKAHIERLSILAPEFSQGLYLAAKVALSDPSWPSELRSGRAGAAAEEAAEMDSSHAASRVLAGGIAIGQGRYDEASKLLDEAAALAPPSSWVATTRARLLSARGHGVLARDVLEEAVSLLPGSCSLWEYVHRARGDDMDVAGSGEAARILASCSSSQRLTVATHLARRGEQAAAIDELRAWTRFRPDRVQQRLRLAELLEAAGRYDEAVAELEALRDLQPGAAAIRLRLADTWASRADGRADDEAALSLRREALALDPGSLHLRRTLAFQAEEELLDWAALDLDAAIAEYQAEEDGAEWGTDAVLVVDHAAVEVFAEDPVRPVVVERVQVVTQVLTRRGLDRHGEVSVPRGAEIVALHTRKRDGRILDPEITPSKDTITLAGLEVGDFIVQDYVISSGPRGAAVPGWAGTPFYVSMFELPLRRVSYVARAPRAIGLEVEARNVEVDEPRVDGEFVTFHFSAEDVQPLFAEHDSPSPEEVLPWLRVGAGAGLEAYGYNWGDFLAGRARVDHEVRRFTGASLASLPEQVRRDPRALARALAMAVNEHVLGSTPSTRFDDDASQVLVRGRGNRLIATKAVLAAAGLRSRIALVRPFDSDPAPRRFPAGDVYRYAVLKVYPGDDEPPLWIDQNHRTAPVGRLRPVHSGAEAILLAEPGVATRIVRTPAYPREEETRRSVLHLSIDEAGNLSAEGLDVYTGFWASSVRGGMERADEERRRQAIEQALTQFFGPVSLGSLRLEGADPSAKPGSPVLVSYSFEVPGFAGVRDGVIEVPGGNLFPALVSRRLVRLSQRALPILLQEESIRFLEATFELPRGYSLSTTPEPVSIESRFGRFSRMIEAEGGRVSISERLELSITRVLPHEYLGLARFAAEVDAAQARGLTFEPNRASTDG